MKRTTTLIAASLAASIASIGAHAVGPGKNRLAHEEPQQREERREDGGERRQQREPQAQPPRSQDRGQDRGYERRIETAPRPPEPRDQPRPESRYEPRTSAPPPRIQGRDEDGGSRGNNDRGYRGNDDRRDDRRDDPRDDRRDDRYGHDYRDHRNDRDYRGGGYVPRDYVSRGGQWRDHRGREWRYDRGWYDRYRVQTWRYDRGRYYSRHRYAIGYYDPPPRFILRLWVTGDRLPSSYYERRYIVHDYWRFDLYEPPYWANWVRVRNDALLIDRDTGEVLDVVYDLYW